MYIGSFIFPGIGYESLNLLSLLLGLFEISTTVVGPVVGKYDGEVCI